ncbi:MAG: SPFH domain-containing protein [Candidatus Hodarchaeota archaeon]
MDTMLIILWCVIGIFVLIWILSGLRVVLEYERMVIFRLGKYKRTAGPGVVYKLPIFEKSKKLGLRIMTLDIPSQKFITKDNIPAIANTVVYFKVENPEWAITKIENYKYAVLQYTQTAIRDVLSNMELDNVLTQREKIATDIKNIVDKETATWGIDIQSIKMQEFSLPENIQRAMAAQAEAEREKRASIIASQGEMEAAGNLSKAAQEMGKAPGALYLRTLSTLRDISQDPSQKIIMLLPSDYGKLLSKLVK